MAEAVSCGIDDKNCKLSYDRSAPDLAMCSESDFSFEIQERSGHQSVAVFTIVSGRSVLRRNESNPFPTGALTIEYQGCFWAKKPFTLNNRNCIVQLKKHASINLNDLNF